MESWVVGRNIGKHNGSTFALNDLSWMRHRVKEWWR
jgi:hypothetical protein